MRLPALLAVAACVLVGTPAVAAPGGAPTVLGEAGRAATVVLSEPLTTSRIRLDHALRRASGVFIVRLDGEPSRRAFWYSYFDGDDGPIGMVAVGGPESLPRGRYAVHLLGAGEVRVDLDRDSSGPSVRARSPFPHRLETRDVELEQVVPGRWKGGIYDVVPRRSLAFAGIHLEGTNVVGDSDFCSLPPGVDDCLTAPGLGVQTLPRWLRPDISRNPGRDHLQLFNHVMPEERIVTSYDGLTPPRSLSRSLLVFTPLGRP